VRQGINLAETWSSIWLLILLMIMSETRSSDRCGLGTRSLHTSRGVCIVIPLSDYLCDLSLQYTSIQHAMKFFRVAQRDLVEILVRYCRKILVEHIHSLYEACEHLFLPRASLSSLASVWFHSAHCISEHSECSDSSSTSARVLSIWVYGYMVGFYRRLDARANTYLCCCMRFVTESVLEVAAECTRNRRFE
jgi:hypothetical protein